MCFTCKMRSSSVILALKFCLTFGAPQDLGLGNFNFGFDNLLKFGIAVGNLYSGGLDQNTGTVNINTRFEDLNNGFEDLSNINIGPEDVIGKLRSVGDSVKSTLKEIANDPTAAAFANTILSDNNNVCIRERDRRETGERLESDWRETGKRLERSLP